MHAAEARARRGRLRIFFGATAGVGKTFAMLEAARVVKSGGVDIAVGYVEPHGRVETERLLEGLDKLSTLAIDYRGIVRQEFDLDGALERRPAILIVDELAHSNLVGGTPAPRHPKRWQDIEELLDAGIDVWTTVNVQHLESLNDVVAQITGARQRETLPDAVFDRAHEVELIDLPPDDLLARLHAGKIYLPDDARAATEKFFRLDNLHALRELALRRMTLRIESSGHAEDLGAARSSAWLTRERILVATGPDPQSEQLVRAGKRLADALRARWVVVYVETPALTKLSEPERNRRVSLLRLAESLGAEAVTIDGPSAVEALLEYAATREITRAIVGAPKRSGLRALLRPSAATELARRARTFDVITVAASDATTQLGEQRRRVDAAESAKPFAWRRYAAAVVVSLACSGVAALMYAHLEAANLVMIYLLGVVAAGLRFGRGPSVLTAVLNVASFDFFFVPPRFTFAVGDAQYLVTFAVMLLVALVIATLVANVRQQTRVAGARERRTALLYAMSRELAAAREPALMADIAVRHVAEVFQCEAAVLLPNARAQMESCPAPAGGYPGSDFAVAQWVLDHGKRAGFGSDTLPAAPALYLPLGDVQRRLGVLAVLPHNPRRVLLPEQLHLLETFAGQIGLAIERVRAASQAESARVAAQSESLRNTLLASISHDLRTPLAVIAGAGSTLADHSHALDADTRASLARSIEARAREMSDLVSNVLDLTRFESGAPALRRAWETIDELAGVALERMRERLGERSVALDVPGDLQPVFVDATLVVQLLTNLLDNLGKYTRAGTHAILSARNETGQVRVALADDGGGLPPGDPARLFDKFHRGRGESAAGGVGLGLAIAQAIVQAHGGEIRASNANGGARFEFTLPAKPPA
jgi:two-component system sensor histidine kinase KdpD